MKQLILIAGAEWRYWLRSHLALSAAALFIVLILATSMITALHIDKQSHAREHHQQEAEETFLAQPDRHPHRMVHYGHYVFRAPAPLALFDPGLDSVTGQSIFLEGHRQNSAMFTDSGASASLGGLSWLTPAIIYQLFGPLLLLLLGHGAIVREREAGTLAPILAQGTSKSAFVAGKALALFCFILVLLIPLLPSIGFALKNGESILAAASLLGVYLLYLSIWGLLALLVSSLLNKRSTILAVLTTLWLGLTLVLPSIAVNVSAQAAPIDGKIESDMAMAVEVRKLGDGHNVNDPAFKKMRSDLLAKYGVERVEDLPINFRGLVAMNSESQLTGVLNKYAQARMLAETEQAAVITKQGWLSPTIAVSQASRSISATDLEHYHRFLREAEETRFTFVQGLNKAHTEVLSYQDDINRNKDEESSLRARVGANTWNVLEEFRFQSASASARIEQASQAILMLVAWLGILLLVLLFSSRRLTP